MSDHMHELTAEQDVEQMRQNTPGRYRGYQLDQRNKSCLGSTLVDSVDKIDWPYAIIDKSIGCALGHFVGLANNIDDARRFAAAKDMQDAIKAFLAEEDDPYSVRKDALRMALEMSQGWEA